MTDVKNTNLDENVEQESMNTSVNTNATKQVEWSPENEMIMVEWCDVAQCYKWLNTRSNNRYSIMHAWFTIPAITLSTISGTASFAQASLPTNMVTYAPMVIGSINIFIGILTTIQQYLKISELNESHRVAAIAWDKFARNIRIELAKSPHERTEAGHFLKVSRDEFDRLMETSPMIPMQMIREFKSLFAGKPGSEERRRYDQLKKPDICDIIVSANESRHHWYKDLHTSSAEMVENRMSNRNRDDVHSKFDIIQSKIDEMLKSESLNKELELKRKQEELEQELKERYEEEQRILREKEEEVKRILLQEKEESEKQLQLSLKQIEESKKYNDEKTLIHNFIEAFENLHGRRPTEDEILSNFKYIIDEVRILEHLKSVEMLDNLV